jgi:primosomal protein N' (replication factor Y) (superfamily II helicase)
VRVCRVLPDIPAIDRAFDYLVTPDSAGIDIGTIVRVPLHGRRVRGWVVGVDAVPETTPERLRPITAVVSAGPPPAVVELCQWAAWRWAGPMVLFLRGASPPNVVAPGAGSDVDGAVYPPVAAPMTLPDDRTRLVTWPPARSRVDLVRSLVASEGSTLLLVPDAREAERLADALRADGRDTVLTRGATSGADRTRAWEAARHGARVVVGGRSAVLAPVPDLRAVIVLDEADEALEEERAPAWHARELARERARRAGASFDLVTPAPTIDAMEIAPARARPDRAIERTGWPVVEVVDLRVEPPGTGLLSTRLGPALHAGFADGGRAVCVLNRRGRARLLACRACGELARCDRCAAALAEVDDGLACPRCATRGPARCEHCGGTRLHARRLGVTRARDGVAGLVPRATVVAVDRATAEVPSEVDVLVGTEAVLHRVGHGGRPVRLVAFLDLDQELLAARYRAAEQALWLLVRAARLVGSRGTGGRLLLQTRLPDHEVIAAARDADPLAVATVDAPRRRALGFPPFGGLAELTGNPAAVADASAKLREATTVLGPSDGRALVRGPTVSALCDVLASVDLTESRALGRLRVDVDPTRV